ncbi:MAG: (d)CMP kinase, partial [Actinomycetes bacterium]
MGCVSVSSDHLVVAIDGPAGSGKSTTARSVAKALDFAYLDTGALYRAMTWWMLNQGID